MSSIVDHGFYHWLSTEPLDVVDDVSGVLTGFGDEISRRDSTAASDFIIRSSLDTVEGISTDPNGLECTFRTENMNERPFSQMIAQNGIEEPLIDLREICNSLGIPFDSDLCPSPANDKLVNEDVLFVADKKNEELLTGHSHHNKTTDDYEERSSGKRQKCGDGVSSNPKHITTICKNSTNVQSAEERMTNDSVRRVTLHERIDGLVASNPMGDIIKHGCIKWMESTVNECESLCGNLKRVSSSETLKFDRSMKIELTKVYYSCKQFIDFLVKSNRNINSLCGKRKRAPSEIEEQEVGERKSKRSSLGSRTKRIRTMDDYGRKKVTDQAVTKQNKTKPTHSIQEKNTSNKSTRQPALPPKSPVRRKLFHEISRDTLTMFSPIPKKRQPMCSTPFRIPKIPRPDIA